MQFIKQFGRERGCPYYHQGYRSYKIPLLKKVFQMIQETDSKDDDEFEELSSEPDSDSE